MLEPTDSACVPVCLRVSHPLLGWGIFCCWLVPVAEKVWRPGSVVREMVQGFYPRCQAGLLDETEVSLLAELCLSEAFNCKLLQQPIYLKHLQKTHYVRLMGLCQLINGRVRRSGWYIMFGRSYPMPWYRDLQVSWFLLSGVLVCCRGCFGGDFLYWDVTCSCLQMILCKL